MGRPRRLRRALGIGVAGTTVAAAAATAVTLADTDRRHRLERQVRVYRLTVRRAFHFATNKLRAAGKTEAERAKLDEQFAVRSAEDVAKVLGGMKGAIMKAGQMVSFIAEGLPPEAQAALATLQADVPPMAPSLARQVVREELGDDPDRLFLDWDEIPVAAASIGQVHRAVMPDGRIVAVKVQYPGVDKAIKSDLDNAEMMYGLFASFAMKNMDVKAMVDELRQRMGDELDYRLEAASQAEIRNLYEGHPFIHVPKVVPERSARRVLTSEWIDGQRWDDFLETAPEATKQKAAEVLFRFAQGSINRYRVFNGDPHPGNYRFHADGSVTFLDFGLLKRWGPGELELLTPALDAMIDDDVERAIKAGQAAGFLPQNLPFDHAWVFDYISAPYRPFMTERFRFTKTFVVEALQKIIDIQGEYGDLIKVMNMPTSYVILDRVVWGVAAMLAKVEAENAWQAILAEYRKDGPPATELGRQEREWLAAKAGAGV